MPYYKYIIQQRQLNSDKRHKITAAQEKCEASFLPHKIIEKANLKYTNISKGDNKNKREKAEKLKKKLLERAENLPPNQKTIN